MFVAPETLPPPYSPSLLVSHFLSMLASSLLIKIALVSSLLGYGAVLVLKPYRNIISRPLAHYTHFGMLIHLSHFVRALKCSEAFVFIKYVIYGTNLT